MSLKKLGPASPVDQVKIKVGQGSAQLTAGRD